MKNDPLLHHVIDNLCAMTAYFRKRYFSIAARYYRGEENWLFMASPGRPETAPIDFDGQQMFLNATRIYIPAEQPEKCLQFLRDGKMVFEPEPGDLIRYKIGPITVKRKIVERGNEPCWDFLFGNREIWVNVEEYRE